MLKYIACALIAVALVAPGNATATASAQATVIRGRIFKPDGKPLSRAIIRLFEDGTGREVGRLYSDDSGRFEFPVPPGQYIVEVDPVTDPDLEIQRQFIHAIVGPNVRGGEVTHADFWLKKKKGAAPMMGEPKFEQEVPPEAARDYRKAMETMSATPDEAHELLRKALQAYPDYYDALVALGTEYAKKDHLDHAMVVLVRALEINPKSARANYALGVTLYKKQRYDLAAKAFRRADAITADNANVQMYLGLALAKAEQNDEAETTLKRAYSLGAKGVPELHLALAQVYVAKKRYKEAAAELRTLLKETPNLADRKKVEELAERYEKQ